MSNFDLQSRNNSSWTIEGLRNIQAMRTFIKRIHFTTKPPRSYLIVGIIFVMITPGYTSYRNIYICVNIAWFQTVKV